MRILVHLLITALILSFPSPLLASDNKTPWLPSILFSLIKSGPSSALCAEEPPPEGPAAGLYRSYTYVTPTPVTSVAISMRGWRTVAGTGGSGLYFFNRNNAEPIVHALVNNSIEDVDMSRDGSVAAASDGDGNIYLFECDASQASWSYPTGPDDNAYYPDVEISLSDDGRWLAAASDYHIYLFRRDKSIPVLKLQLSQNNRLSTLAFSGDGTRLAVATEFGTSVNGQREATLFLLDKNGVRWQTQVQSEDVECTTNIAFLPLALSRDGGKLATAGCDDQLRFWNTADSTPLWTAQVGDNQMITGLAMAADGKSLAINGDTIRYVRDTSTQPDFSAQANWAFNYWLTYQQPSVYGILDSWSLWDGTIGKPPVSGLQNLSISDNGHYIFAGATSVSYLLHRDDNEVTRLFGAPQDTGQYFGASAVSPESSWVVTGSIFGNEILRFEVAPVQKISTDLPLTVTFPDDPTGVTDFFDHFGVSSYTIAYTVLKPGRAADINQYWTLWGFDGTFFLSPTTDLFCTGDAEWTWTLNLGDGDIESIGSREINPPQCVASNLSTISVFDLFADFKPEHPEQGGVSNLYTDSVPLLKIQVGSGN